jgi:hypothetical protein
MKIRNLVLSGVAALAVAGASTAFAQQAHDTGTPNDTGPQYSTPAEHAQTEQLNSQAQSGTTVSPQALNGDAAGASQEQGRRDQAQAQYQAQQAQYQDDKARYDAQRRNYERNIHRYDEARYYFTDYPAARPYRFEDEHLHRLYLIADPTHQLANAPVEGPDGQFIGRVRNVETAPDGRPAKVEVALNRRVSVYVNPDDLRFDAADHVVFTKLTRADLWDMPGATYESGAPM